MKMKLFASMIAVTAVVGCSKKSDDNKAAPSPSAKEGTPSATTPSADPAPAKPPVEIDTSKLKVTANGWEGEFNKNLKDWVYEKYTPGKDGMNERNSLTISSLPDDVPTTVDEYATKLQTKDFQDFGFKYSVIKDKTKLADGWLITGTVVSTSGGADEPPEPGFVIVRDIGGGKIRCKSMTMKSEKIRADAIELCKSIKL
jgi:hypothetical protein